MPASITAGTYLEKTNVVPKALFLCVEELSGRQYIHASDRWQVRRATTEETSLLEIAPGAPGSRDPQCGRPGRRHPGSLGIGVAS